MIAESQGRLRSVSAAIDRAALPARRTTFVGRAADLEQILGLVDTTPIVTLVGIGGAGKTRLAVEAAARVVSTGLRTWFVELADVAHGDEVLAAIADAVGIVPAPGASVRELLVRRLAEEPTLLVLDNFEHVLEAAPEVAALVDRDPGLRLLTTSRRRLRVRGEHTFAVEGLPLPSARQIPTAAPSVELFLDRADLGPPTPELLATASRICARVGGLPLAIELAAFRAQALGAATVDKLVATSAIDALNDGPVDAPVRQRTLRRSLEWSYSLLDPEAQRAFRVLGAFAGSFDLPAFSAVAGADDATNDDKAAILDAFAVLVEHHLIEATDIAVSTRFTTLPPIRELARSLLLEDPECAEVVARHSEWFATVAVGLRREADAGRVRAATAAYREDQANLALAVHDLLETGEVARAAQMSCDLATIWTELGHYDVMRSWLDSVLTEAAGSADDDLPVELEMTAVYAALVHRAPAPVESYTERLEAALERARRTGDDAALLRGLAFVALSTSEHHRVPWAISATDEGAQVADRIGANAQAAEFLMWRAMFAHNTGDLARAHSLGRDALQRARTLGDDRIILRTSLLFSSLPSLDGGRPEAALGLESLLELARTAGNPLDELYVLTQLAMREAVQGDVTDAFRFGHDALALARNTGAAHLELLSLFVIASAAFRSGDAAAAARFHGSIAPHAATLPTILPPGAIVVYDSMVESGRRKLGAGFDRRTRVAETRSWDDEILGALHYAARQCRGDVVTTLTPRELEVLGALIRGATNKEIAAELGLTPKTVMHHCGAIYRKLGVKNRGEAAAAALRNDLVPASVTGATASS